MTSVPGRTGWRGWRKLGISKEKSFWKTRSRKEVYGPQLLFKETFPSPTPKPNPLTAHGCPQLPQHSTWLLHLLPAHTRWTPLPLSNPVFNPCPSVGSCFKAHPESHYSSHLPGSCAGPSQATALFLLGVCGSSSGLPTSTFGSFLSVLSEAARKRLVQFVRMWC